MESQLVTGREITFARLMSISILVRLMVDSSTQMFSPFLPVFAAGLGTTVIVMGRLVGLRSAMGLAAPFFGAYADRHGYRQVMRGSLLVAALGHVIVGFSPTLTVAALGMMLMGLGAGAFVPTHQAYLSARLPYHERARGIGILEYSWALTGIVGLSLMGVLIAGTSWRAPFLILSAGILFMSWVVGALPSAHVAGQPPAPSPSTSTRPGWRSQAVDFFRLGENARSAYGLIASSTAGYFAIMLIMVVYGAWLADEYALGPRQLGTVALLFGCFDLVACVSVSLFTDRLGKLRSVILGSTGTLLGYLLIPWLNIGLIPAILATGLARGFFEFTIVSTIPLMSEQVPTMRGKVMTLNAAASLVMVTVAGFVAPALYTTAGIAGVAVLSSIFAALALLLVWMLVREAA